MPRERCLLAYPSHGSPRKPLAKPDIRFSGAPGNTLHCLYKAPEISRQFNLRPSPARQPECIKRRDPCPLHILILEPSVDHGALDVPVVELLPRDFDVADAALDFSTAAVSQGMWRQSLTLQACLYRIFVDDFVDPAPGEWLSIEGYFGKTTYNRKTYRT